MNIITTNIIIILKVPSLKNPTNKNMILKYSYYKKQ